MSYLVEYKKLYCLHKYVIIVNSKGGITIKEYTIFCIYNGGKPFFLNTFYSLEEAKIKLYDMISLENERNRAYYVDNDFFNNIYPYSLDHCKYFCIKERNVSEWEKTSVIKQNKNNIIYFNKRC